MEAGTVLTAKSIEGLRSRESASEGRAGQRRGHGTIVEHHRSDYLDHDYEPAASADSDVVNADSGIIAYERQLTAAHAQLEAAEANDVKAQADLVRYKMLVDKGEVSRQIYDQALAAAEIKAPPASRAAIRHQSPPYSNSWSKPAAASPRRLQASNPPRDRTATSLLNKISRKRSRWQPTVEQRRQQLEQAQLKSPVHQDRRAGVGRSG